MKRNKLLSVFLFVFRAITASCTVIIFINIGGIMFHDDGIEVLIEKISVFSAKASFMSIDKTTEVSYFTAKNNVAATTAASEKSTVNTTTSTTTQTTVPTGENIKKVSEEKLIKGNVSFDNINVKNTNKNHSINIKSMLSKKPVCELEKSDKYQVLIIHTHTTECYASEDRCWYDKKNEWRSADDEKNIIAVGAIIADELNNAGIKTLHVTKKHDYPKYNGAYTRSKETIKQYLKQYPSIKMVIDVHRDSITRDDGTKVKPTAIINGKKAAQVMIISGCDDEGDLDFPNWEHNLRMAVQLQRQLTDDWPGLARPLYFAPFRYNMHLTDNSLLLEFGTEVNTLEEAKYSASLVAQSLVDVLSVYIKEA